MKFAEALSSLELKSVKQAQIVNKGCDFVICRFVAVIADIAHHTPTMTSYIFMLLYFPNRLSLFMPF